MAKIKKINTVNPKFKQSEIVKHLALSTSTLQRYRSEINMLSLYRKAQSSNTHARKQRTSNNTMHDLK